MGLAAAKVDGSDMKDCCGGVDISVIMDFFLCWRRKMAPRMTRATRAMPPMTPPTMAPVLEDGAGAVAGASEEVAALALAVLVAEVASVEDSVVEVDDSEDDDDEEEDDDEVTLLEVLLEVLVDVEVCLTVDIFLSVSSALVVWALSTVRTFLVAQ